MRLFYCAKCGKYEENFNITDRELQNIKTFANIRDGYGRPIIHVKCPNCGYLLAGTMQYFSGEGDEDYFRYAKDVIRCYTEPNFYGYWNNEDREKVLKIIQERRNNFNGKVK